MFSLITMNKFRLGISDNTRRYSSSFKSFIGFESDPEYPAYGNNHDDSYLEQFTPKLLSGEMVVAEAQNVLLYRPVSDHKSGQSGVLFVTNFKLSFVTSDGKDTDEMNCQKNFFLGPNDVCLSNVDILYQVGGGGKKKLIPGQNVSDRVKGLFVICKNMKSFSFCFKFSPLGHGKTLTNALLHHAFPRRHQLLFAYDYREPYIRCVKDVLTFREAGEWGKELARTQSVGWRLSPVNHDFQLSTSLPQWIVVSSTVLDWQLAEAARHFRCGRPPLWCWSSTSGAALVRTADIIPTITDRVQENIMLETVRKAHPKLTQPIVLDLAKDLPSPKELDISFNKLRDLCTPESLHQFWIQDKEFLPLLESSRWLAYVSQCLVKSVEAARSLEKDITVVLQERDGRDMCCLVSSLIQLLLDPFYRTLSGLQSLIQKEWVVMGHAFCTRLGHVFNPEAQQSPVFLLFLDCVWQLTILYPSYFQFSETYLTTVWDAAHLNIFDTFLFDCDRDRLLAAMEPNNPLTLRCVWDWGEQFPDKDISLFINPLYNPSSHTSNLLSLDCVTLPHLQLWSQAYFRFSPPLELVGGGPPQFDSIARSTLLPSSTTPLEDLNLDQVGSFYPFTQWRSTGGVNALNHTIQMSTLSLDTTVESGGGDDATSCDTGVMD
uniref:Myotubularin-related protein 12 n=1 Tax=Cacopsylla melanoneura TaxID=428564 RepID=A0A8D8YZH2_9HEMI